MDREASGDEGRGTALWASTFAFTICFAVWTIFSIIGVQIKKDLGLNDTQFGLASGIVTGSLKHASHFRRNSRGGIFPCGDG